MRQIIILLCILFLLSCNNKNIDKIAKISIEEANRLITESIARNSFFETNDGKTKVFQNEIYNKDHIIMIDGDILELSNLDIFKKLKGAKILSMDSIKQLNIRSYYSFSIGSTSSNLLSIFFSYDYLPPKGQIGEWEYITYWYRYQKVDGKWKFKDFETMGGE